MGTVEHQGESLEELIEEMKLTFEGKYGEFIPEASYVATIGNVIISSSIIVNSKNENIPLLAHAMTHPEYQNKGYCSFLIRKSMNSLVKLGETQAFLAVAGENRRAISVYSKLGFQMR